MLVADRVKIAAGRRECRNEDMTPVMEMVAGADCIDDMDLLRHGA
jgi:hypothetical protein